jgi:hypothetical protein
MPTLEPVLLSQIEMRADAGENVVQRMVERAAEMRFLRPEIRYSEKEREGWRRRHHLQKPLSDSPLAGVAGRIGPSPNPESEKSGLSTGL